MADGRWVEVSPSQFPHEAEGLRAVRSLLPDRGPFRAWSNFEFRDDRGNWSEVDLLILAPDGLHLLELKYYSGRLRGTDQTWLRDGRPAEDSPLLLANRKAKRLRSKLMDAYDDWKRGRRFDQPPPPAREVIPFIRAGVLLHHPGLVCDLPDAARLDLYALPEHADAVGLDPITDLFVGASRPGPQVREQAITGVMQLIGLRARPREAGQYLLDAQPLEDGPGWQDWLATHKHLTSQRRRIRFRVVPEGSPEEARRRVRLIASHELSVMQRLTHDAILRPEDYVDAELGPGLVYPFDPAWQRLDLWLAGKPAGFGFDAQLALVRRLAEAVAYAHGKNVVHRGLSPRAVLVRPDADGRPLPQLTDWQGVGRLDPTTTQATRGVTVLMDAAAGILPDAERWAPEGFTAPEGVLVGAPGRLKLDVFSLGALAFYLVTGGQPPARTRTDLAARLREQGGLDVSVELPAAPPALREAILKATAPQVSERLPDVAAFLALLDQVAITQPDEVADPLDAGPGAFLGGRFELIGRLGSGSTAVGLFVKDLQAPDAPERVLKVALDDAAARRLADEADALRRLASPRIVKLIEGPIDVAGRRSLLLASAGRETLGTYLGNRERLSLDLLERWGIDLLEALVALDAAGVNHRDIKPSNLGVRVDPGNRSKHLMLFDFSLTRAAASDTQAGTRPYLDPFLSDRRPYDSAAERYAAAVVLFEMATGHQPVYGDGLSDPAAIADEATLEPSEFDASARARLAAFFTAALARDAGVRHHTAQDMLRQWRACFPDASVPPADADALAAAATADTPLEHAGLTPRAISALEQLRVTTVGELAQVDAVLLARLAGSSVITRNEIKRHAKVWRAKFGRRGGWSVIEGTAPLPAPSDAADVLLAGARTGRDDNAVVVAARLLGVTGSLEANATQAEVAASLRPVVTRGRVSQLLATLQDRWAAHPASLALLSQLTETVDQRLRELGGVATFDELAGHLLSLMVTRPEAADPGELRRAEGLLRCAIDRAAAKERAEGNDDAAEAGWLLRRREGRPLLVAQRAELLDVAEALGRRADALVAEHNGSRTDALVPAARVAEQLGEVVNRAEQDTPARAAAPYAGLREGRRLARLAADLASRAAASATGELHHRDLDAAAALRHAMPAVVPGQRYSPDELRNRVRARFPQVRPLPDRPALDSLVDAADIGLRWDDQARAFRAPAPPGSDTTGLNPRTATALATVAAPSGPGAVGQRLLDSRERRSFVALGVGAQSLPRFTEVARARFDAVELDLTHALLDALHATAAALGVPWSDVLTADADAPGTRAHQGLHALAQRSLPALRATIEQALADAAGSTSVEPAATPRPLLLTDPSLLARYDGLGVLSDWMDLATPRPTALWLVVPQLPGVSGPMVDGQPLALTAPNQYVPVTRDWIDAHRPDADLALAATPEGTHA